MSSNDEELRHHITTQRRELFGLRFQHATGALEDTASLRTVKRELARALTVAGQRGVDLQPLEFAMAERSRHRDS